ncbi:MAG TPA: hypothetical protein VG847_06875, partial [Chitinophagaceae bacterium]|nr:hypothetical protein [Chitinophagaceae bacterium]
MNNGFIKIGSACWLLLMPMLLTAQSDTTAFETKQKKLTVTGYLKDLQGIQILHTDEPWMLTNLVHNRFDVHWYIDSSWKFQLGIRNRFYYGDTSSIALLQPALNDAGDQLVNLSKTITHGPSYLLNTAIDRAFIDYTKEKWEVSAGRQRINWGVNLVWNPNDIFNAYSYFDFDYEERPGSDAVRIQYYFNSTNSAEIAYKPGSGPGQTTIAGLYRFTKGSYDFQALGGIMQSDYVAGGGWSGTLGQAGFNGELTAFLPQKDFQHSQTVISASVGINYTFSNSLYLHGAYLLNSAGLVKADSLSSGLLLNSVSAKSLSPSRHSVFGECAYQFSPLIRGDFAAIINPSDGSFFAGPFITVSLSNTLELLGGGQLFFGDKNSLYGNYGKAIY